MPNELDAIKHELRHFERQSEKVAFHKEHLSEAEEFGHDKGQKNEDGVKSATFELREYHEKLARKLKKLEHYLDEKLKGAVHNEL